jgi:hypothetical protein
VNRLDLLIPATAGILAIALGLSTINIESAPLLSGDSLTQRVSQWTVEAPGTPFSVSAQNLLLADCETVLANPNALALRYLEDDVRTRIPQACRAIAENIIRAMPASGYGWLVVALAAGRQGDNPALNAAIRQSRTMTPTEAWIAEDRLALAANNLAILEPETIAAYEQDIRMLAQTQRVDLVAELYAQNLQSRDRISAIVESLPPEAQQRFVGAVETALAASR